MRSVNEVPVVTAVLGSESKKFEKWLEKLQVDANISVVQKKCYLVGNRPYPKESFRTIRKGTNLLALGHLLWSAQ